MNKLSISVIVPCYNEEAVIDETFRQLKEVLEATFTHFEILFINDGSRDQTFVKLQAIALKHPFVKVISFSRNFGHQPAVTAGINHCKGDYAIIIDADLQDPPKAIPHMVALANETQANVVYGVRRFRHGESIFKKLSAKVYYRLLNYFSETKIPVDTGDFRLIDRTIISHFNKLTEKHKYIRGLISWLGFKQVPYFYDREERFAGETHYPFFKMLSFAFKGLLYFSKKPIEIVNNIGLSAIIISILFFIYSVIQRIIYPEHFNTGWTSIIGLIIFFGGIQLVSIGMIGSYIGNMFDEMKDRPEYIIDQIINDHERETV
jgi:dolichol-phosphate mannosyltransferase